MWLVCRFSRRPSIGKLSIAKLSKLSDTLEGDSLRRLAVVSAVSQNVYFLGDFSERLIRW